MPFQMHFYYTPPFFTLSPTFIVNFTTFPTTLLTFEAQNKVGISGVSPLLLLPYLQFRQLLFPTSPTFAVQKFPHNFWAHFF
jgi:hypothetical protein